MTPERKTLTYRPGDMSKFLVYVLREAYGPPYQDLLLTCTAVLSLRPGASAGSFVDSQQHDHAASGPLCLT